MIKFGGVDLTDLIPQIRIEDIHVSPIAMNPVARQRPIKFGADFVRMGGGTRTVTLSVALLEMDAAARENALNDLRTWAQIGTQQTLDLPHYDTRHLECAVTGLPDASFRKWWENKLQLVFTCFDNPYWTSNDIVEVACGTLFSIGGTAPPLVTIERNGVTALTNQVYSDGTAAMTFATIPRGQLIIDLNRQTAAIGATSIMQYYSPLSTWIDPKVGAFQRINGVGAVKYRERWV